MNPLLLMKTVANYALSRPPRGMDAGSGVKIQRPNRINAPCHISVGCRTTIGSGALIDPIVEYAGIRYAPQITIGKDVYIGPNLYLVSLSRVSIGDGCVLSESVFINDNSHGYNPDAGLIMRQALVHCGDIYIGNHCFLGLRSAIMGGVTLGEHCIVGINSVVTRSFPAYSMVAGAPARLVKRFDSELRQWVGVTADSSPDR